MNRISLNLEQIEQERRIRHAQLVAIKQLIWWKSSKKKNKETKVYVRRMNKCTISCLE